MVCRYSIIYIIINYNNMFMHITYLNNRIYNFCAAANTENHQWMRRILVRDITT